MCCQSQHWTVVQTLYVCFEIILFTSCILANYLEVFDVYVVFVSHVFEPTTGHPLPRHSHIILWCGSFSLRGLWGGPQAPVATAIEKNYINVTSGCVFTYMIVEDYCHQQVNPIE